MDYCNFSMAEAMPYWTILKDVVTAGIAIYAVNVAHQGLTTWNRQLKGGAEYDLARRVLKSTYLYREAIAGVRHPYMSAAEMRSFLPEDAHDLRDDDNRHRGTTAAYDNRWKKVWECRDAILAERLEAEALWGAMLEQPFKELFSLQNGLYATTLNYVRSIAPRSQEDMRAAAKEETFDGDKILYSSFGDKTPDAFALDVETQIKEIETLLKPHLQGSNRSVAQAKQT